MFLKFVHRKCLPLFPLYSLFTDSPYEVDISDINAMLFGSSTNTGYNASKHDFLVSPCCTINASVLPRVKRIDKVETQQWGPFPGQSLGFPVVAFGHVLAHPFSAAL